MPEFISLIDQISEGFSDRNDQFRPQHNEENNIGSSKHALETVHTVKLKRNDVTKAVQRLRSEDLAAIALR